MQLTHVPAADSIDVPPRKLRYVPLESVESYELPAGQRASGNRIACPLCQTLHNAGAAILGEVEWSDEHHCCVAECTIFLDCCSALLAWVETYHGGQPRGEPIAKARLTGNRRQVEAFLRKHRFATGVLI